MDLHGPLRMWMHSDDQNLIIFSKMRPNWGGGEVINIHIGRLVPCPEEFTYSQPLSPQAAGQKHPSLKRSLFEQVVLNQYILSHESEYATSAPHFAKDAALQASN